MISKNDKKLLIRNLIIDAADVYSTELAGKVFLYVFGDEYFELLFKTDRFMHLTGVDSHLSAKDFYKKSKNNRLALDQFSFKDTQSFSNSKKKLPCLIRLPELTKGLICVAKGMQTLSITYKLGITNLEFTLGVAENVDSAGNLIDSYYMPRTLRVNDKAIENSNDAEFVDFIFVRDASKKYYETILYKDNDKTIPTTIYDLLSDDLQTKLNIS